MSSTRHHWRAMGAVLAAGLLVSGCLRLDVNYLASDGTGGRANGSPGSGLAQNYLLGYLTRWAVGPNEAATGSAAYQQPFSGGTNILGIIPGTDLAEEFVVVGAHYDGLGESCRNLDPADIICNGATDNATGAAAVLAVARAFAYSPTRPRRSILVAFWDREEDGLLGARHFLQNPLVPLDDVVAYVNFDIVGANLRGSLRDVTFAIGAETGGARLREMVAAATGPSTLDTRSFSQVFGQGRSDHAPFIAAGIPTVFFSDSTGPCYHTDMDDSEVVDHGKLAEQVRAAWRLMHNLASTASPPSFQAGLPLATYADAVTLAEVANRFEELDELPAAVRAKVVAQRAVVNDVVAAGPAAFDDAAITAVLLAALDLVDALTYGPCEGYFAPS